MYIFLSSHSISREFLSQIHWLLVVCNYCFEELFSSHKKMCGIIVFIFWPETVKYTFYLKENKNLFRDPVLLSRHFEPSVELPFCICFFLPRRRFTVGNFHWHLLSLSLCIKTIAFQRHP